ncbi:MAG: acyl-CoA dehydrogenase family protein [Actinomycetota bacterium]|nr:acyl-CoA dehydrogenase family protein [Acidimicrobiales bacterium]MEC7873355.1 acyl-CoA dehydrogenase family protein [Actinomycetota bacterium]MEC8975970.1 acyl-CoA dehydrogenase family protein [Actinomycetota bacterium]MEC9270902.1 acyl-CoA dehydrogenase family protein [Actinomycetota bacterium]MEC9339212.1 acyl-CoA dehydrogenase family protein [Actinomycetota bacterium]
MSHGVTERIEEQKEFFTGQTAEAEALGQLPDETTKRMKATGVIRLLQPPEHGGYAADPTDFMEAVMALGNADSAVGWVAGVIGVHPWEMAFNDQRVLQEVWGQDADTWVASPYAPNGIARQVDGGFVFNGKWEFSSGTDSCDWIVLGGLVEGEELVDGIPQMYHFLLPRSDYEIVEDSWNVMGLRGTGSKDIIVNDAVVPEYRVLNATKVFDGTAATEAGRDEALYRMPWSAIFPVALSAAVVGICEGALACHYSYQASRTSMLGPMAKNPYLSSRVGEAASEIHASRSQLLYNVSNMYALAQSGVEIPLEMRIAGRRDQVRAARRAVEALDDIYIRSGGGATRDENPLAKWFRDAHTAINHTIFAAEDMYHAHAAMMMGQAPTGFTRLLV